MKRARRAGAAFTLLEVLGAVAILGITATVLATASIESMRRSGDARGGLAASLLADDVVAELRATAARGGVRPGSDRREQDGFTIRTEIQAAELGALGLGVLLERESDEPEPTVLMGEPVPTLWELQVEVAWGDERAARSVERTTFLFDPSQHPDVQALKPEVDEDAAESGDRTQ